MSTNTTSAAGAPFPEDAPGAGQATESLSGDALTKQYTRRLWFWLAGALLVRLFILHFPYEFTLDVNTFRAWTDTIIKVGPAHFYSNTWSDYPPLFLDFLWIWGLIQMPFTHSSIVSEWWMKLPACLADVLNGYLIFQLLKGRVAIRSAYKTAIFYTFNPVVIFLSAVWGQVDAIITMMMLLIGLVVLLNWLIPAATLAAAAFLTKPQGVFMWPVVFSAMWFKNPVRKWPVAILAGVATVWLIVAPATWDKLGGTLNVGPVPLPAFIVQPFFWLAGMMNSVGQNYPYSTVNAFNIWMLPPPNETWKSDSRILFFLPHHTWGVILAVVLLGLVAWYLYRNRDVVGAFPFFLASSVTLTGIYMVMTRMHERYIFPAVAFLALAQACNRRVRWIYWGFSATAFLSIAYVFYFYNDKSAWVEGVKAFMENGPMLGNLKLNGAVVLSLVNIWLFGELLSFLFVRGDMAQDIVENPLVKQFRLLSAAIKQQALAWADVLIPAAFALGFFLLATWRLGIPGEQIFDEVYHARTAMEYIAGVNPYEWTHPPLAKLLAAVGILIFHGEFNLASKTWTEAQAFDWRYVSVVFGALTLPVTYAMARSMFGNRLIASLATGFLMLDGVFFVQSRVAMTNIYEVFFIMLGTLGTWLYLKSDHKRWLFLMAFGLGCGLATRWSCLYGWASTVLVFIWYFWSVKRLQWGGVPDADARGVVAQVTSAVRKLDKRKLLGWVGVLALTMAVIPAIIYLLTYIPFVLQGDGDWQMKLFSWNWNDHAWGKVIALQKDMYNYHAHLVATHPYSSPWWSWPIMLRPTWYYFHDWKNGTISGVWAIGNAFVWWASIPALTYAAYMAWRDRLKSLGLLALLGFGQWLAWGVQPRPLLYMHYMFETIPFACIALAYICYLLWFGESVAPAAPAPAEGAEPVAVTPFKAPLTLMHRRVIVGVYLGLVVFWFIYYYPLLSALPVPWNFYNSHLWFGRAWI